MVLAAPGYPTSPEEGDSIRGIEAAHAAGALVFHGATAVGAGGWRTAGGRVLTLVGRGEELAGARRQAYEGAAAIDFEGMHYRSDIAAPVLATVGA